MYMFICLVQYEDIVPNRRRSRMPQNAAKRLQLQKKNQKKNRATIRTASVSPFWESFDFLW